MSALVFAVLVAVAGVPLYGLAWLHKRRFARNAVTLQQS
jgi:predicted membrane-bound mannosyltransferase